MSPSADASQSSGRKTAFWVVVTGAGQAWRFILSVASAVVLARLLLPRDFGLIATVAPIVGFIDLLRDAGFSQALVQRENVTEEQGHALFWMVMLISAVLGVLLVVCSPLIAAAFHEPRLVGLLAASAFSMQIASFSSQPWAWLNRNLRFRAIASIDAAQGTVGLAVSVVLAGLTHSYWSIVIGGICTTLTSAILAVWISGWRPGRPTFDKTVIQMARFGAGVSFSNITNFLSRNSDNLLIARFSGQVPLGYYDRAYKLMLLPLNQVSFPISRVLVPVLSRQQAFPTEYRRTFLTTISYIMAATQPGLIAATVLAAPFISTLLGPKWAGSIPIFAWLGAAAVQQTVTTSTGWLLLSQGRGRDYAISGLFGSVTAISAFLLGLRWGPVGVAAAYTIVDFGLRMPFAWWFTTRHGPVTLKVVFATLGPHLGAVLVSTAVVLVFKIAFHVDGLSGLMAGIVLSYLTYLAALMPFDSKRQLVKTTLVQIRRRVRREDGGPARS